MQSLMFVFAGLPEDGSMPNLSELGQMIENKATGIGLKIKLDVQSKLLKGHLNDVNYYVSFMEIKEELKDWYTMAEDFKLMLEKKTTY